MPSTSGSYIKQVKNRKKIQTAVIFTILVLWEKSPIKSEGFNVYLTLKIR